jgi:hypothetical protein
MKFTKEADMAIKKTAKTAAKSKKNDAYECRICGYRIVIDEACGCAEEHVFVCCDKPMKKTAKKAARKS